VYNRTVGFLHTREKAIIERIEIRDFENHVHTVIDDLSGGFSLIRGMSNSGKTAIIRALRLVVYNEWDPKSLRIGCKNCVVEVTTQRGTVRVTRGKDNLWEITPKDSKTESFSSIGKAILPQAAEILGMNIIKLGDSQMQVNIMDQLERHFMMSELGGKNASGSVRAQIIDEISGLSGIEVLIRDVSLDNRRNAREVKEQEEFAKSTSSKMYDQAKLDTEQALLASIQELYDEAKTANDTIESMSGFFNSHETEKDKLNGIDGQLAEIPDLVEAESFVNSAVELQGLSKTASELLVAFESKTCNLFRIQSKIDELPDTSTAEVCLSLFQENVEKAASYSDLTHRSDVELAAIGSLKGQIDVIPDTSAVEVCLNLFQENVEKATSYSDLTHRSDVESAAIETLAGQITGCDLDMEVAQSEFTLAMTSITICPLSLQPIGPECLKRVRIPVRSVEVAKQLRRDLEL